jgi:FlaA1/EpsC-like NDP-sugar epimerase
MSAPQVKDRTAISFFDHVLRSLDTRKRVLILGDSVLVGDLITVLTVKRRHWYDVVGVLTKDVTRVGQSIHGKMILGTIDKLFETVERLRAHIIAIKVSAEDHVA